MNENKYQRGKINKIVCNKTGLFYVGSTTEKTLSHRLGKHRSGYKSWIKEKTNYVSSYQILEGDDYDIVLLESCPCSSKDELHKKERYYIETLYCVNRNIAGRTLEEYNKEYREANKTKISEYQQQYRQDNKDKLIEQKKKYLEVNKEIIQDKRKEYYLANKDKMLETFKHYRQEKTFCLCGGSYTKDHKAQHCRSLKHK
jgi:hypothetical protein